MELVFYHSLGGQPGQFLSEIVQVYNESHDPKVSLKCVDSKNYASAAQEALEKTPEQRPHFILAPEYMTGAMQQALTEKKVISVNTLLDKDRLDDIAQIVSKTFGVDCLPFNPACGVLYMNKKLLKESGFSPDWKPETFEELIEAVEKIKEKTGISHGYTCAWPEAYLVEMVLAQKNQSLLDTEGKYHFSQLNEHVLHLRELVKKEVFLVPSTGNYDPTRESFIQGKVAFYMQGSGHSIIIEDKAKTAGFEVGYAPLPTLSKGQKDQVKYALPLGGAAIWVFNTKQDKEEDSNLLGQTPTQKMVEGVRSFLNYLASKEVQAKWHQDTAYVPVSKSVRESLHDFYKDHPLHEAVIVQTVEAPTGENSFGIKKGNYHQVRPLLYPFLYKLLTSEDFFDNEKIKEYLIEFDAQCNSN